MTTPDERTAAEVAAELKPKHAKRLLLCAHDLIPWSDAVKSHRQLRERGLVMRGTDGDGDYALGSDFGREVAAELEKQ